MIFTVTLNPALDKEYQVPKLIIDEIMRMSRSRIDFGGKGFNVSRMLQSLGVESIALGFVGGHTGDIIVEGLRGLGIQVEPSPIIGETRTNISIVGETDSHYVKINEKGPSVSKDEVDALLKKINTLVRPDDFWVLAGSIPTNVPDDIYAKIIHQVNRVGGYAVLDTSGIPLRLGIAEKPFIIKPNIHELSYLVNMEIEDLSDLTGVVSELHSQGLPTILVSLGEAGAFLSDGCTRWQGRPPKIKVQNPIGAGDAMVAGLVWRLSIGDSAGAALPWSIACGTAAANIPGTGMPSLDIVKEFQEQVKIEEI
jgi:1-phosphofructokinase family hexose kinase